MRHLLHRPTLASLGRPRPLLGADRRRTAVMRTISQSDSKFKGAWHGLVEVDEEKEEEDGHHDEVC